MKSTERIISIFILLVVTSTISNAQIQPPAGLSNNIILWLSPDTAVYEANNNTAEIGDRVRIWNDISGNNNHFVQNTGGDRPRYRDNYLGRKTLEFRSADFMENTGIASIINGLTEFSVYMVIKSDDVNTDQGFLDSENPEGDDDILCLRYDASGANTGRTNLIKCGMQGNSPNNQIESQSNTQSNSLQVLTLTWKINEKINLYIDGVLNESSVSALGSAMSGIQKIIIGKGPKDTGGSGWDGRIGTVIFYSEKMSPDTVSLVSGDLKSINSIASGNWNSPSTWDCNCNPPNNAFVTINSTHAVSLTQNEIANNVIIKSGGTLSLSNNNRTLTLNRNFTNHGSLTAGNGTITFSGSAEQLINGTANTGFYSLTSNNTNGVRLTNGSATVSHTLNIVSGCFNTNNKVTLLSNATRTARLASLSGSACVTGDITMQRYVNAGSTNWRFLTSPVSGATLAQFNDDFETSGYPGAVYPNWPTAANPWPSTYSYDETQAGAQDNGFTAVSNASNIMAPGEGFWVWCGDTITGTQPFTFDITGSPNTGNINLPISYTNSGHADDGWNMSGNPYPSTINWDSPNITKTNMNNAIYIWNPDNEQFASYVAGIGTNGGSGNIASSQAFWVQASGSGASIQVTEASKTSIDGAFLKPTPSIAPLRIKTENTYGNDELVINFEPAATSNFDGAYDAEKIASSNIYIPKTSSTLNGLDYSINQIEPQEISIPIKILTGTTGPHIIRVENAYDFNPSSCLILEDLFTNNSYNLSLVDSISTVIYDTTLSARFLLHIGAPIDIEKTNISCFGNVDSKIVFTKNSINPFDIIWKDHTNTIISSVTNVVLADSLTNLNAGTYYIETTDILCGNVYDTVITTEPTQIIAGFSSDVDTTYLSNGGNVNFINQSTSAISYSWNFGDFTSSNLISPSHQYTQNGDYLVTLNASQDSSCFEVFSKNITVLNTAMAIENITNQLKIWIYNKSLLVKGTSISSIKIRNILGQALFSRTNTGDNEHTFDLTELSSQILIVTTTGQNGTSSIKVNFIKK